MGETVGLGEKSTSFRPDVEGLRALAVAMVLLYHIGIWWTPGGFAGVDVFFVISGFLITGQLVKEVQKKGTISLLDFYSRRAKRLFPAAAVVLLVTMGLTVGLLPRTRWSEVGGDIFASAAYFINWRLAGRSVDYLAEDSVPSPVQHFWSLSVEEQYYIVWPVVLVFGLYATRRWWSRRPTLWIILAAIGIPSLAWSIYQTHASPAPAYFSSLTRMWELAIGGGVALVGDQWRVLPKTIAVPIGWLGLAAIVVTALWVTNESAWPGYLALMPTVGAAAVIASGFSSGRSGPISVLGTKPLCWVGGVSYSLYLWHWPLIEIATSRLGKLPLYYGLVLGAISIFLAWLTRKFVEDPVRFAPAMASNPRYALSSGLNFSFVGAIAGLFLMILPARGAAPIVETVGTRIAKGAEILRERPRDDPAGAPIDDAGWITPDPALATKDLPDLSTDGCMLPAYRSKPKTCVYGDKDGLVTIAMVGDSKIGQWLPALQNLATRHHWRIVVHTKASCGFNSGMQVHKGKPFTACYEWNRAVLRLLLEQETPDYVLTSQGVSRLNKGTGVDPAMVAALQDWWRPLEESGAKVIALADNPHPGMPVYECVSEHPRTLTKCAFRRAEGSGTPSLRAAAKQMPGVSFIDLTDAICPTARCAPVIGNVLVYRQGSHITRTYIETLAPRLERALKQAGVN